MSMPAWSESSRDLEGSQIGSRPSLSLDPEGVQDGSRGLSASDTPGTHATQTPDPEGVADSPSNPRKLTSIERTVLEGEVIEAIRQVYDPEIPVNVYDLGLIYDIKVDDEANVDILMTLTSPMCPVAETLPGEVELAAGMAPGVKSVRVELTWDPPFTIERMSDEVKLMLGLI